MDSEYLFAAPRIRRVHHDSAVEPAGSEKGGIEHVRAVGRGDHDDACVRVESVHLYEKLVQCLLALVVSAAQSGAALAANSVDLIDEDERRAVALCSVEQ